MTARNPTRSKARRIVVGLCVSSATLFVLALVLEVGVRVVVPEEVFSPFQPIYRPDEIAGFTMRRGFRGHALGAPLETNSLGFRGPEWSKRKAAGTYRVALIGDSHAFGFGVAFEEGVGERLAAELAERRGQPCEVLNFALPGYNSRQQLAVLRGYALDFDPDAVLVLLCENDHDPAPWCDGEGWLHLPTDAVPEGSVRAATHRLVTEKSWLRHSRAAMYLKLLWRRATLSREMRDRAAPETEWMKPIADADVPDFLRERVYEPIAAIVEACRERGIEVTVASLAGFPRYRRVVRALREAYGVPTFELMTLYPEVSSWSELSAAHGLGWDDHLNAASHARWAEALAGVMAPD